ncbi:hypothetical protein NIES37_72750 (plasmid) [Tolypothrix tenuis PCC 7101]|uniref:Uncharacterized protein n=1 Tax=Tolypothrix tenuis PCC 7101 TaxID=231146 RepID=A0A1Z4NC58_9CYAN|nr:hypothetical protein [Aulosira sp. FACHB-113]BAZ03262.1 hypothetical protein NIES37_72750 [Tolypothrix tenuis PCC 7101]BAZ78656.1 hypothetical protein NIES50_72890 [Aulosira laxa NIES-50]
MHSIKLTKRIGADGVLHLDIPVGITDKEVEIMVIYQPLETKTQQKTPEQRIWMPGFFEEVIGGWVGEPLERPEQGNYEIREQLF